MRVAATLAALVVLPCCAQPPLVAERITVGVIDTGIGPRAVPRSLDVKTSTSFVDGDPSLDDRDGHGTEMAWIVHRAAPQARLIAVKVFDAAGATSDARIAAGIRHLDQAGADIALISLAGAEPLPRTYQAIRNAEHMTVYAAAGNDGIDLAHAESYPGGYQLPNLVTVAATDPQGRILGISNRGGPTSAEANGAVATCTPNGEQVVAVGTSPAAALAAGRAANPTPARPPLPRPRCPEIG